jgi:ABC-type multidrug transport system ATPase subunit
MQRRVAVASALVGDPELILLDEPLAGLDPRQAGNVRSALAELRGKKTLIVSSHNLSELERLCDWVVMMDHGSIVEQGPMADVTGRGDVIRWDIGEHELHLDALRETLAGHLFVRTGDIVEHQTPAQCDIDAVTLTVMRYLVSEGVPVRNVSRGQSLERAFFDSTASSPPSAGGAAEGN